MRLHSAAIEIRSARLSPFLLFLVVVLAVWVWVERRRRRTVSSPVPVRGKLAPDGTREMQALDLSAPDGECDFHIVGESNYQPELRRVSRSGRTFLAVLALEPTNPVDPNAIVVIAEGGKKVGYLNRDYAADYHEVFTLLAKHGRLGACRAKLIGGVGKKKSFGVMLNLKDPETLLVDVRDTLAPGTPVSDTVRPF